MGIKIKFEKCFEAYLRAEYISYARVDRFHFIRGALENFVNIQDGLSDDFPRKNCPEN